MKLLKINNYKEMSEKAGEIVINQIKKKPNSVIAFATGKTPPGLYREFVKAYKKGKVDFSKIKAFNLDEYYPISKKDKKSFYYYMHKNLFDKINIKKNQIDLQILGVGVNGHIAFNEPGSALNSKTRLVELTSETKKINKINKKALTMGVSTILSAKKILLLASGRKKAEAVRCLIRCKPNKCCPVSFLKKHKNLIVIVDKEAGRGLG